MRNYNSIDLMKFVMALCVVTIHTYIVDGMNPSFLRDILHSLIRNAVPFFFITSSFFIMKRERDTDVKRYWKSAIIDWEQVCSLLNVLRESSLLFLKQNLR